MSEPARRPTEELAYLLWEQQGRPENRSGETWLEAEYMARLLAASTRDENEIDLRMRGLGPLTQDESSPVPKIPANGSGGLEGSSETVERKISSSTPMIASCVAGAGVVIALGLLYSFYRKSG